MPVSFVFHTQKEREREKRVSLGIFQASRHKPQSSGEAQALQDEEVKTIPPQRNFASCNLSLEAIKSSRVKHLTRSTVCNDYKSLNGSHFLRFLSLAAARFS